MRFAFRWVVLLLSLGTLAQGAGFKAGDPVEISWSGHWYKGKVLSVEGDKWRITYDGYASSWDETVGADRLRAFDAAKAADASPGDNASAASPAAAATYAFPARPAGRAGIDGAYLRVMSWYFNGRLSLDLEGWFFTKEGRVSRSPAHGFSFAEFNAAKSARKTDGAYGIEGKTLTIAWADGSKRSTYTFESKGSEGIVLDGVIAVHAAGFTRGWRVDAHYEGGASVGGGGSYAANSNSLELRRDGTFGGGSVGSVSSSSAGSTVSGGSANSTHGTYAFEEHTLVLTHADGRIERATVFPFGDTSKDGVPTQIWREGTMLHRRDI